MSVQNPPLNILSIFNPLEFDYVGTSLTTSEADSRYLKLTGGTLTGSLTGNLIAGSNYSFVGDTTQLTSASNTLGIAISSSTRLTLSTTGLTSAVPLLVPDGSSSVGSYGFSGSPTSSLSWNANEVFIYRNGVNHLSFADYVNCGVRLIQANTIIAGSTYTIANDRDCFSFTTTGCVITLPAATSNKGRTLIIHNGSTGTQTINRAGTDNLGIANATSLTVLTNRSVRLTAVNASHWVVYSDQ